MAKITLKDLETGKDLDHKALAKVIGGHYGKRHYKRLVRHHWRHRHGGGHGHWRRHWHKAWGYYKKHRA